MTSRTLHRSLPALTLSALLPALAAAQAAPAQAGKDARPTVLLLATGGTIAGAQPKPGEAGYKAGSFSVESLIQAVPGLDKLALVKGEQVANIGSQDMNDAVWVKLAQLSNAAQKDPTVQGIVVTHGTDTMEETGFFLDLVSTGPKPIVLTGSMRPATAVSPDGPMNLYNAVGVAIDPAAWNLGALIVMNDDVFFAAEAVKTNTTSLQTFHSPNGGLAGNVNYGRFRPASPPVARRDRGGIFSDRPVPETLPRVLVVYSTAGAGPELVEAAVAAGAKGIVLAGVGDGNATTAIIQALSAAAKKGVVVVRSSRVGSGVVARNVELDDDRLGFVAAMELNPQKARVLLQLALTRTTDLARIQKYFDLY